MASGAAPELAAAMAETRILRTRMSAALSKLRALADDLDKSADLTHPSKKSEVEKRCARDVRIAALYLEETRSDA